MEQTLVNGIADNLLHNIFNDLSVGLELYDKDGLMIDGEDGGGNEQC